MVLEPIGSGWNRYLLVHPDIYNGFRDSEIDAILESNGIRYRLHKEITNKNRNNHLVSVIDISREGVDYLLNRAVLISRAISIPEKEKDIEEFIKDNIMITETFRIEVSSYIRKVSMEDKIEMMNTLRPFLNKHVANLSNPDKIVEIVEIEDSTIIGILYRESNRKDLLRYSLKNRLFIGTTAMDNELAFLMANLSQVQEGKVVLDCFSGTGSILLPCAVLGALVIGLDSNPKQFKGMVLPHTNPRIKTLAPGTDIYSNFFQYNLLQNVLFFGHSDIFSSTALRERTIDAIICDPPYGQRESASESKRIIIHLEDEYMRYSFRYISRVFELARSILKTNGRISFFLPHRTNTHSLSSFSPFPQPTEEKDKVSWESLFCKLYQCTQYLNSVYSRTLFTYKYTGSRITE
ncbi:tRNA (guanine10-N2)-methyltransferase [Nematocida sp. AWRm80]|nr:tRNA (guanine10-N2)-methyltransferase [Nematocida sp. AWRm80]